MSRNEDVAFERKHHVYPGTWVGRELPLTEDGEPRLPDPRPRAKTDKPNPKDLIGARKPATLSVIPSSALLHMGRAMSDGSDKYGSFNWREHPVKASIYVDACLRHLMAWFDGERDAEDSGVHHLGHAMACLGILVDAEFMGGLLDDRPAEGGPAPALIKALTR